MATNRTFSAMLNEYLPNDLLAEELVARDYVLNKADKDDGWLGGNLVVPFKAAGASSVSFGSLTAQSDVAEDVYVRGNVASQKEAWGTMIFNHRDLMEHDKVSEKNFLKLLPGTISDFMALMKNTVSINLLKGTHIAKVTALANAAGGQIKVDRPDLFMIGQKVQIDDTPQANSLTYYVTGIDMNTSFLTVSAARGGAAYDFSGGAGANNIASGEKIYNDGAKANAFSSLRGALLSAANGGDTNLYGVAKTSYPFLQAINVSGASITAALTGATTIMAVLFDSLTTVRQNGRGNPTELVMSYRNFAQALKCIEASKGAYNVAPGSSKTSQYGWTEVEIGSVKGAIKLVAVQEMDEDVIFIMDWKGVKFHSNGFFRKRQSPDGTEYFEVRATTGYQYLIDVCLFGELVVTHPSRSGVVYGISY
jgi:hypothetical protein